MPQSKVDYASKTNAPGLVVQGLTVTSDKHRGYDNFFFNDTDYIIPFGSLCRYTGRRSESGGLIAPDNRNWDRWLFSRQFCGIAIIEAPYIYHQMYPDQTQGYRPKQRITLLQKGDVWLRPWTRVRVGDVVSYKRRPLSFSFVGEANTVGMFSNVKERTSIAHEEITSNARWITSCEAGELAIARVDYIEPLATYFPGEGDDF